ncbi:hypothetical protein AB0K60_26420 [Thermopolyspora sp. NPDC052614]|uniref:hypothetical protein n=1 Tax=Thermopolyspora sp. NPDC052614 TaxID=3155682 RepID=UPI00344ABFC1
MPTVYVSTASMVLTAPATGGTLSQDPTKPGGLTNPLLQFNDGLRTTAGILILAMNAPDIMAELGIVDGGPTSLVINDGRTNPELLGISTNGPFIYVEAESTSAAAARDTTIRAKKRIQAELVARQQALRAPRSTYIWMADVVPPSTPEPKLSAKFTAAGAALVVTLVAGFGLAYAVIQIRAGRAGGKSSLPVRSPVTEASEAPDPQAVHASAHADPDADRDVGPARRADASRAEAPTTDMTAPAPDAADGSDPADEPGSAGEPSEPVITTVIRRSEWPEPVSDEPAATTRRRGDAAGEPDGAKDEAEPVATDRAPGASDDPDDWEETAAWSDDATRELRARLTGEDGDADGRDGSDPASPAEDSYVVVVPGRADRDGSRGHA